MVTCWNVPMPIPVKGKSSTIYSPRDQSSSRLSRLRPLSIMATRYRGRYAAPHSIRPPPTAIPAHNHHFRCQRSRASVARATASAMSAPRDCIKTTPPVIVNAASTATTRSRVHSMLHPKSSSANARGSTTTREPASTFGLTRSATIGVKRAYSTAGMNGNLPPDH